MAVDEDSFDYLVLAAEKPVLVEFWASWCEPCARQAPVLEELADAVGERAAVAKINADENAELLYRLKVKGIPTMKVFRNGAETATIAGVRTLDVLLKLLLP